MKLKLVLLELVLVAIWNCSWGFGCECLQGTESGMIEATE